MTALRSASTATAPPTAKTEWSKAASCLRSHVGCLRTVSNDYRFTQIQIARNHFSCTAVRNSNNDLLCLWIALPIQHEYDAGTLNRTLGRYELDLLRRIPLLAGSKACPAAILSRRLRRRTCLINRRRRKPSFGSKFFAASARRRVSQGSIGDLENVVAFVDGDRDIRS